MIIVETDLFEIGAAKVN